MEENNELYKSLGQVPELVKLAQNQSKQIDRLSQMVAQVIQRQMTATIPAEEHQKMARTIANTPCAAPNMTEVAESLSKSIMRMVGSGIHDGAVNAVKDAVKDTPVTVTNEHVYKPSWEMTKIADETLTRRFWIMFCITAAVVLGVTFGTFKYFNSDFYFSQQYEEIRRSKFLTDDERKMLNADTYYVGIIPKEFYNAPDLVKAKIKRNKQILRQRQAEAKHNNGKFSTKVPLER